MHGTEKGEDEADTVEAKVLKADTVEACDALGVELLQVQQQPLNGGGRHVQVLRAAVVLQEVAVPPSLKVERQGVRAEIDEGDPHGARVLEAVWQEEEVEAPVRDELGKEHLLVVPGRDVPNDQCGEAFWNRACHQANRNRSLCRC